MNKYLLLLILCTPVLNGMNITQKPLEEASELTDVSDDEYCELNESNYKIADARFKEEEELDKTARRELKKVIAMGKYDMVATLVKLGTDLEPQELEEAVTSYGKWAGDALISKLKKTKYAKLCSADDLEKAVQEENKTAQNKMLATIEAARLKRKV